jgi:photosystem II stability/assembly factor-like uncharacterized protein
LRTPLLLVILLGSAGPHAAAQVADWQLLDASPFAGYRFEDGSFVDPATGFIVDPEGRTHRTTDGGATWELRSDVNNYLRAAAFTSATHGWVGVLFSAPRLYETTDAAATMVNVTSRISPAIAGGICGLFAVNADTAFGVGQYSGPAYVIRTVDGGASWQSTNLSPIAGSLVDVYFHDGQHGLAVGGTAGTDVGGRVVVLATENGGVTWTQRYVAAPPPAGQGEWAWKISFPTPLIGYVSVERTFGTVGKILKTIDGGLTWTEIAIPGTDNMQGIGFLTAERGWLSGRGEALTTVDGGLNWTPTSSIDAQVNRFEFFGDTLGFAMGQRIYAIDARTVTPAGEPGAPGIATILDAPWPNPSGGVTHVRFRLESAAAVHLAIFDALGRSVAILAAGARVAGSHEVEWSGRTGDGRPAPAGVYVARLVTGERVATRTFAVVR